MPRDNLIAMKNLICSCFQYPEEDIILDVQRNNGESKIMARILTEKKAGGCQCHLKNPTGR